MSEKIVPITKLEIKNFRCVYDATVDLDWFTVLIGKNDTGKTSILEALSLLAEGLDQNSMRRTRRSVDDLSEVVSHGAGQMLIAAHFDNGAAAKLALDTSEPHRWPEVEIHPTHHETLLSFARTQQPYALKPAAMRGPAQTGTLEGRPLPSDGSNLIDVLVRMPHRAFGELLGEYTSRLPEIDEVLRETYVRSGYVQQGSMEIRFRLKNGDEISARQASDGAMLVLGFLALIMDKNPPQLILLEEPENGIHPGQLAKLIQSLIDLSIVQNRVQIVMTTHSPFVLDAVDADNVRVVTRNTEKGTKVHRFAELEAVKRKLGIGFSVGEAWVNMDDDEVLEPAK